MDDIRNLDGIAENGVRARFHQLDIFLHVRLEVEDGAFGFLRIRS